MAPALGPIIPPSIHLVLYAALAEVGVDYLFLGGVLAGLLMAACLMVVIYILVRTASRSKTQWRFDI